MNTTSLTFELWKSFAEQSGTAVIVTDLEGIVQVWSDGAERLYGWPSTSTVGRPIQSLTVGPTDVMVAREIMDEVVSVGYWEGEFLARANDGEVLEVHVRDVLIHDANGEPVGIAGVSFDVGGGRQSIRERAEGMRSLARAVNEARQKERQQIARNLHDDVGQVLTYLRSEMSTWVESDETCGSVMEARGPVAMEHLDSALRTVRDMSSALIDSNFDVWVMVLRIFDLTEELQRRTPIITECDIDGTVDELRLVDRETALVAYQVLREALVNCERHSHASHVFVKVKTRADCLTITIVDDGVGVGDAPEGVGRRIMRDRVDQIGGKVSVEDRTTVGASGTFVEISLPILMSGRG